VEIATGELSTQKKANFMLEIHDHFGDITNAANAQVPGLLHLPGSNLDSKMLQDNRYIGFLKALDSSGRVRGMKKQHHTARQR